MTVRPAHPGATVIVERRRDGAWAEWRSLTLGPASRAQTTWRADAVGVWPLRVVVAANADHLEGVSRVRRVQVVKPNPYNVPLDAKGIVVVDISQYRLRFYSYGTLLKSFPCVTGRPSLPTPIGHFSIYARGMWPGGPYGARIMSYHPPCAIHGTNEPWLLKRFPRNFSHGCTRLAERERHLALRPRAAGHAGLERALTDPAYRAALGRSEGGECVEHSPPSFASGCGQRSACLPGARVRRLSAPSSA